jgi:nuclear migration protein JNM1
MTPAAAEAQKRHALSRAADFDARLSTLEAALGLNALTMPDLAKHPAKPILYTLETLDTQISTLSDPASLDPASRKLAQLISEADRLDTLRKSEPSLSAKPSKASGASPLANGLSSEDLIDGATLAKISELYKSLPVIEEMHPTLPMVVERLRTLRLIHTAAGGAKGLLDDVDRRQAEQEREIRQWREALTKVEEGLKVGDESLRGNVGGMGTRIRELEQRLEELGIEG